MGFAKGVKFKHENKSVEILRTQKQKNDIVLWCKIDYGYRVEMNVGYLLKDMERQKELGEIEFVC